MIAKAEDALLRKLRWFRSGGGVSDRQWRDVVGVAKRTGVRLDDVYLDRWATKIGVADLLAGARRESGFA